MKWDSNLYVQKHGFVAEYGAELLDFVPCDPRQSILDLGCGVGTLTERLAGRGGRVLGVTALGDTLDQAIDNAYAAAKPISFTDMHFRTDIGRAF